MRDRKVYEKIFLSKGYKFVLSIDAAKQLADHADIKFKWVPGLQTAPIKAFDYMGCEIWIDPKLEKLEVYDQYMCKI